MILAYVSVRLGHRLTLQCFSSDNNRSDNTGATQWWGDHFLFQLKDMLSETCRLRQVPDCEFFINKRDYPHLKFHVEPSSGSSDGAAAADAAAGGDSATGISKLRLL